MFLTPSFHGWSTMTMWTSSDITRPPQFPLATFSVSPPPVMKDERGAQTDKVAKNCPFSDFYSTEKFPNNVSRNLHFSLELTT